MHGGSEASIAFCWQAYMRTRACKRNPTAVTSFHVLMLLAWVGLSATGQVHSAATADGHKAKHTRSQQHQYAAQPAAVRSRKLLQQLPFAREANINRLTRVAAAVALDSKCLWVGEIAARLMWQVGMSALPIHLQL